MRLCAAAIALVALVAADAADAAAARRPRRPGRATKARKAQAMLALLPIADAGGGGGGECAAIGNLLGEALGRATSGRVVAPATVEAALAASRLPEGRAELEVREAARLGKKVGATQVVSGACAVKEGSLRLWLRHVDVKRKRLAGATSLRAAAEDVLSLVGRAGKETLLLARLPPASLTALARQPRPRLRQAAALTHYGAALLAGDVAARRHALELALDADPTFAAAADALEDLERLAGPRNRAEAAELERARAEAAAQLRQLMIEEKDPLKLTEHYVARFEQLERERRFRRLVAEARAVMENPPPPVEALSEQLPEAAAYLVVAAYDRLGDLDAVVREGQRFVARYPLSNGFVGVQKLVDQALETKLRRQRGAAEAVQRLAALAPADKGDPCRRAGVYEETGALVEAQGEYRACLAAPGAHGDALVRAIWVSHALADFHATTLYLGRLRQESPERYQQMMRLADELPIE